MEVDNETIINKIFRVRLYDAAAKKFIERLDNGEICFNETYNELKKALTLNEDGSNGNK